MFERYVPPSAGFVALAATFPSSAHVPHFLLSSPQRRVLRRQVEKPAVDDEDDEMQDQEQVQEGDEESEEESERDARTVRSSLFRHLACTCCLILCA